MIDRNTLAFVIVLINYIAFDKVGYNMEHECLLWLILDGARLRRRVHLTLIHGVRAFFGASFRGMM